MRTRSCATARPRSPHRSSRTGRGSSSSSPSRPTPWRQGRRRCSMTATPSSAPGRSSERDRIAPAVLLLAFSWGDLVDLALAVFLLAVGLALAYALLRLGETFTRLSAFIKGAQDEIMPVIEKVGGSVERANAPLDKVAQITDSAVDAADSVDTAVRAVTVAIQRPVQKLSGLAAGVTYGAADLKAHRSWRHAVDAGREAAARREQELGEELH